MPAIADATLVETLRQVARPLTGARTDYDPIIDLSKAAATKLGFRNAGTTKVCITRV